MRKNTKKQSERIKILLKRNSILFRVCTIERKKFDYFHKRYEDFLFSIKMTDFIT